MSSLVESPLQLLCAVEAHAAGITGRQIRLLARQDVPALARSVEALGRLGAPAGLSVAVGPPRLTTGSARHVLVGDAFSGVFQAAAVRGPSPEHLVVVDDGLATLDLADRLIAGEPLVRLVAPTRPLRHALGSLASRRVRRWAGEGRVTLFTMLPLGSDRHAALERLGVHVVEHSFEWLASRDVPHDDERIDEPTVVVGSGLVADRLVHADQYAAWLRGLAADGPVRYIPHRRHDPLVTAVFEDLPGVQVDSPGAPVEVRLRGLRHGQRVVSLPSTSAVTLTRLLAHRDVPVVAQDVPPSWWTPRAAPALREHLGLAVGLAQTAAATRGGADRTWAA